MRAREKQAAEGSFKEIILPIRPIYEDLFKFSSKAREQYWKERVLKFNRTELEPKK